ncbi:MAG: NAD-dependent epimerase/dehydratase family protein [Pseudomonadales bacterium]|nr:NAD-dependent epimerase/dehydratase family protein [Pseudomonadales bacterium]
MKKVLVTGAAGFIGSHVVQQLHEKGVEIKAAVLPNESTTNIDAYVSEVVRGDLLDKDFTNEIVKGVDTVFHLAAVYAVWMEDWRPLWEVNLQGSRNMLWACHECPDVKKVVYTSSLSAIGIKPGKEVSNEDTAFNQYHATPYVLSKYLSQQEAIGFADHGMDISIVNPAFPFGPGDVGPTPTGDIIITIANGMSRLKLPGGFNAVDVRDVAAGHILAAEKGKAGELYVLGNTNVTAQDFCRMVAEIDGKSQERMIPVSQTVLEGTAMVAEWVSKNVTHKKPPISLGAVRYGNQYIYMDCSKAKNDLGYQPRDIRISIKDSLRWFRENGYL